MSAARASLNMPVRRSALRMWLCFSLACMAAIAHAGPERVASASVPVAAEQQTARIASARALRESPGVLYSVAQSEGRAAMDADPTSGTLAVFYPDIDEPFRSVFMQIIDGIQAGTKRQVLGYPVRSGVAVDVNMQLGRNDTKGVIALGRHGLQAVSTIGNNLPVVVGGVLAIPDADRRALSGISLTPDPALLFSRLRNLLPGVKRVTVIYNPQQNDWLIKLARDAAKAQGLELVAQEARDLASAARLYEAAFAASDSRRDAIWLPQDATTVDENTILPLVLRESWNRNVAVFSSSFLHVKKGALFALYPNNTGLGRALAEAAEAAIAGDARRRGMLPLRDVLVAVNLRTASHIGLNIGYQQQRSFDFVFPEP